MTNILEEIAIYTKQRVEDRKLLIPEAQVRVQALALRADTGFPFEKALGAPGMSFLCEVKKASPSKGVIAENFPYMEIACDYEDAGAAAISVLTEPKYFQGADRYLSEIASERTIPVLRKDFTVDAYQIYEAKILGAAAILLICAILTPAQLTEYLLIANSLGLSALVEVHTEDEMRAAVAAGARLIGVNNRDLTNFRVDIGTSVRLAPLVPPGAIFVSESGIRTADDIRTLRAAGVDAVLIGETLMRASDRGAALRRLRSALPQIKICGIARPEDVSYVNEARPDYIGFVFAQSKRRVTPEKARALRALLRRCIVPVGVFADADIDEIEALTADGTIEMVQLHGNESAAYIIEVKRRTGVPVVKAVRMTANTDLQSEFETAADHLLIDSGAGSGQRFDWNLLKPADGDSSPRFPKTFFLAGGICAENIEEALRTGAFAVDVSSGAETDGHKDRAKILELVRNVRNGVGGVAGGYPPQWG